MPPLPCSAYYRTVHERAVDNSAVPEVQDAYITVVKHILFREVALKGLESLLRRCDETYWKYASLKVDAIEKNKSAQGESFNVQLRTLARLQDELAVSLAHIRSVSISVVEGVYEWRLANRQNKTSKDGVTLLWKKENYLIKMLTDVTELLDVPIMWMWVGFDANPFIIPPENHNPTDLWRSRELLYQGWLQKHKEHVQRALDKMRMLTRAASTHPTYGYPTTATTAISSSATAAQISEVSEDNSIAQGVEKQHAEQSVREQVSALENGTSSDVFNTPSTNDDGADSSFVIMNNRSSRLIANDKRLSQDSHSFDDQDSAVQASDLRKSAILLTTRHSSSGLESSDKRTSSQGSMLAPKTMHSNLNIVLEETNPGIDEEMSQAYEDDSDGSSTEMSSEASSEAAAGWQSLRKICMDSWIVIKDKSARPDDYVDPFWDNVDHSAVVVQAAVGFTETMPKKILVPSLQKTIVMLCDHLENELHREKKSYASLISLKEERSNFKKAVLSAVEARGIEWGLQQTNSWQALEAQNLLRFRQQYCPPLTNSYSENAFIGNGPLSEGAEIPRGFSRGDGGSPPKSAGDVLPSFSKFHDSTFDIFLTQEKDEEDLNHTGTFNRAAITINKEKTAAKSVEKVEDERQLTARVRDSIVLVKSRKSKRAAIERMRVTPAAIVMQALARGWLTRRALKRRHGAMVMLRSAVLIQRGIRRLHARYRAKRLKLFLRRDAFKKRKEILKKNKCAFVLTKFMRWAAFIMRKTKSQLQVSSISKDAIRNQLIKYGKSTLKMQRLFRGHRTRKRISVAVVDSNYLDEVSIGSFSDTSSLKSTASLRSDHAGKDNRRNKFNIPPRPGLARNASLSDFHNLKSNQKQVNTARRKLSMKNTGAKYNKSDNSKIETTKEVSGHNENTLHALSPVKESFMTEKSPSASGKSSPTFSSTLRALHSGNDELEISIPAIPTHLRMRAVRPENDIAILSHLSTIKTGLSHTKSAPGNLSNNNMSSKTISSPGFKSKRSKQKVQSGKEDNSESTPPGADGDITDTLREYLVMN